MSLGAALPYPLGSAGDTLNKPVGATAQVWLETPNFLPTAIELAFAIDYLPFQFTNIAGANSIQANLGMIGVYGGVTFWGGTSVLGFRPYISGFMGGLYDFMTYPSATATISNAATAFALRVAPGFDLPIVNHFGVQVEMPYTVAYQKTPISIWQATFSLRWKL